MREIKFRAWNIEGEIMCYDDEDDTSHYWDGEVGSKVGLINKILSIPKTSEEDAFSKFDFRSNYEVMQYTGLKDKNGVEIWERDKLYDDFNEIIYEVIFDQGGFVADAPGLSTDISVVNSRCEVIGNIYENPELLEGEE